MIRVQVSEASFLRNLPHVIIRVGKGLLLFACHVRLPWLVTKSQRTVRVWMLLKEGQPTVLNVHRWSHRAGCWWVGEASPNDECRPILLVCLNRWNGEVSILFESLNFRLREYRVLYIVNSKQVSTSELYMRCDDWNFWLFFDHAYCLVLLLRDWQADNLSTFLLEAWLHYQSLWAFEYIILVLIGLLRVHALGAELPTLVCRLCFFKIGIPSLISCVVEATDWFFGADLYWSHTSLFLCDWSEASCRWCNSRHARFLRRKQRLLAHGSWSRWQSLTHVRCWANRSYWLEHVRC